MDKHHSNLLIILCVILALIGALITLNFYIAKPKQGSSKSIIPTFADVKPGPKTTTIEAPNGKMNLIFKEEKVKEGVTETFYTQTDSGGEVEVYSETLPDGSLISVPYNTFSPDNKYIFLKKSTPAGDSYFVLKTDGSPFKNNEKTIDFVALFDQKYPDITNPKNVTGWGGMNLIVVNADKPDGTVDRSFWYDVTSNSFIALSSKFN